MQTASHFEKQQVAMQTATQETQLKGCFLYHSVLWFYIFYNQFSCKGQMYILYILYKCIKTTLGWSQRGLNNWRNKIKIF